jgi:hypothetical protein
MKPRTHFRHTIDRLDAAGEIVETIAGVDDFEIAETTWLAALRGSNPSDVLGCCQQCLL